MTKEDKRRDNYYKLEYGISLKDYNRMLKEQGKLCALCGRHQEEFKNRLAVDHNHKTGQVRGLVCFYCNKYRIGKHDRMSAQELFYYMVQYDG